MIFYSYLESDPRITERSATNENLVIRRGSLMETVALSRLFSSPFLPLPSPPASSFTPPLTPLLFLGPPALMMDVRGLRLSGRRRQRRLGESRGPHLTVEANNPS